MKWNFPKHIRCSSSACFLQKVVSSLHFLIIASLCTQGTQPGLFKLHHALLQEYPINKMINVCCSTCQSIGINIQETSSEMRDYNGHLLFFVLKCCCVNKQVLICWIELHCLPSLRLAFSSLLDCSLICTNPKLLPRNGEAAFCL